MIGPTTPPPDAGGIGAQTRLGQLRSAYAALVDALAADPGYDIDRRLLAQDPPGAAASPPDYPAWAAERDALMLGAPIGAVDALERVCIVMIADRPDLEHLQGAVESVLLQTVPGWELVIVDATGGADAALQGAVDDVAKDDPRITVIKAPLPGADHGVLAGLAVLDTEAPWITFLGAEDRLHPACLAQLLAAATPDTALVFADEDRLTADGERAFPYCKSPQITDALLAGDAVSRGWMVRADLFELLEGFRPEVVGAARYDFLLRAVAFAARKRLDVLHVPEILYHWRLGPEGAPDPATEHPARISAMVAVADHLADRELEAAVTPDVQPGTQQVRFRLPPVTPKISVIVPFLEQPKLLERVAAGLLRRTDWPNLELLLVDTGSRKRRVRRLVERLAKDPRVKVVKDPWRPFNWSAVNNRAVREATGELLLFCNNDIEVLTGRPDWLRRMAEWALQPGIGLVGPTLLFPDRRVQHAGVVVGIGGYASHPFARRRLGEWTPFGRPRALREWLSVTGACMLVQRRHFDAVEGFDERLELCGSDVDLGLRLRDEGLRSVVLPWATLIHHESATRDPRAIPLNDFAESKRAYARYLRAGDPCYNPNLTLADDSCGLGPVEDIGVSFDPVRTDTDVRA